MEPLAWFATTPEGAQLGHLAAQMVQTHWVPVPWWLAPIEPFRWLVTIISSGYPHAKWLALTYSLIAAVVALVVFWQLRGALWQRGLVAILAGLNTLLTLGGGFIAVSWLNAVLPIGRFWVVPDDAPFLLANFHTHTTISNGFLTPEQAVLWHYRRGYRVVGITDSNTVRGGEIAHAFAEQTNLPVAVIVGEEFRGKTHLVVLNIRQDITPREYDVPRAIQEAKRQGGIVIAAHAWSGRHSYTDLIAWGVDGFEVTNGTVLAGEDLQQLCHQHRLAAIGSLDFRSGFDPAVATVLPPWATTPEKVAKALKEGHCATLYLPHEVSAGAFNFRQSWLGQVKGLWRTGASANLLGLVLWSVVFFVWQRRRLNKPVSLSQKAFFGFAILIFLLFCVAAGLSVWAMGRDFKMGWFPPIPLVVSVWAIVSTLNWWLWQKLARAVPAPALIGLDAGKATPQQTEEVNANGC